MDFLDHQLEGTSEVTNPDRVFKLRPEFRSRDLFPRTIFEANAGTLGLLSAEERSSIIDTYSSAGQVDAYLSTPDPSSDLEDSGDGLWRRTMEVADVFNDLQEKRDEAISILEEYVSDDSGRADADD